MTGNKRTKLDMMQQSSGISCGQSDSMSEFCCIHISGERLCCSESRAAADGDGYDGGAASPRLSNTRIYAYR